jgi:hypothetical protein
MSILISRLIQSLIIVSVIVLFSGCAGTSATPVHTIQYKLPTMTGTPSEPHYWWYARFKFNWSGDYESLDFSKDILIVHQILQPVIVENQNDIALWRFHRRAANDGAGHRLAFIFYSTKAIAEKVFSQIAANKRIKELLENQVLEKFSTDDLSNNHRINIQDTSDRNWSMAIQKSWPYYIMGVSLLWLDLINQAIAANPEHALMTIPEQLDYYAKIHEQLTYEWKKQGKHAYFHHINAIFAYEALEVRF